MGMLGLCPYYMYWWSWGNVRPAKYCEPLVVSAPSIQRFGFNDSTETSGLWTAVRVFVDEHSKSYDSLHTKTDKHMSAPYSAPSCFRLQFRISFAWRPVLVISDNETLGELPVISNTLLLNNQSLRMTFSDNCRLRKTYPVPGQKYYTWKHRKLGRLFGALYMCWLISCLDNDANNPEHRNKWLHAHIYFGKLSNFRDKENSLVCCFSLVQMCSNGAEYKGVQQMPVSLLVVGFINEEIFHSCSDKRHITVCRYG